MRGFVGGVGMEEEWSSKHLFKNYDIEILSDYERVWKKDFGVD